MLYFSTIIITITSSTFCQTNSVVIILTLYTTSCSATCEAKGVDAIKLKRFIAIGILKHRATAYRIMYGGLQQRRSGVDHFFSPSQQTSTRATLAYAHARFSTVPDADLVIDPDWPMDTG